MPLDLNNLSPEDLELIEKLLEAKKQGETKRKKKKKEENFSPTFEQKSKVNGPAIFKQEWKDPGLFKEDLEVDKKIKRSVSQRQVRSTELKIIECLDCKKEFEAVPGEFKCESCIRGKHA